MKFVTYVDIELAQTFNNVHPWTMVIYNLYFSEARNILNSTYKFLSFFQIPKKIIPGMATKHCR
jgi:hypothetical protein